MTDKDDNIEEIRRDIEDTRQRISSEIDAIEGKLTPGYARHRVKEKAMETRDRVRDRVTDVTDRVGGTAAIVKSNATRVGTDFGAAIRANPIPVVMIGLGTGWLVWETFRPMRRDVEIEVEPLIDLDVEVEEPIDYQTGVMGPVPQSMRATGGDGASTAKDRAREAKARLGERAREAKGRASHAATNARDRASHLAGDLRGRASHLATTSRDRSRRVAERSRERAGMARDATSEAFDANPVAFGALALLAGIGLGMALPHTVREDRVLGPRREKVVRRAKGIAEEARHVAVDSVKEGARVAREHAKQEAEERNLIR